MRADITSLFGLNVYTNQGTYVGKVNDLVFDVDERLVSGIALSDINRDIFDVQTRGVILPYRWVVTTGDIVIIRDVVSRFKKPVKEEAKDD
ncbi:photosystem reaction center subunit H [Methanococcoides sp. SA1]|nr:photosystem reaction center subunit H [Methanococcoides sp. SA1]NPE31425.1 photosystem reaction center subunit H [Methanococcoides sp. SA1]